jgi:hypothetical protein
MRRLSCGLSHICIRRIIVQTRFSVLAIRTCKQKNLLAHIHLPFSDLCMGVNGEWYAGQWSNLLAAETGDFWSYLNFIYSILYSCVCQVIFTCSFTHWSRNFSSFRMTACLCLCSVRRVINLQCLLVATMININPWFYIRSVYIK